MFCATVRFVSAGRGRTGKKDLQDVCEVGSHGWTSVTSVGWIVFVYGEDIRWMVVEVSYIGATR